MPQQGDRWYAVIYEGLNPAPTPIHRSWHPIDTSRSDADRLTRDERLNSRQSAKVNVTARSPQRVRLAPLSVHDDLAPIWVRPASGSFPYSGEVPQRRTIESKNEAMEGLDRLLSEAQTDTRRTEEPSGVVQLQPRSSETRAP